MLKGWFLRVSGVRDGDHIPMGSEMLPENGIIGFANFAALGEAGYRRKPREISWVYLQ